jgi:tritrans,polycis-undecaprenyl-diphosphate synthase [geranylgeranyl-diphosphate specific]
MMMENKGLHIGIILDGNRRYARKHGKRPWEGHVAGAEKVKEAIGWAKELGVRELTLYSFSIENFNRPENEKKEIFRIFKNNLDKLLKDKRLGKEDLRINFIGRLEMFPKEIHDKMKEIMEETKDKQGHIVNFAMAYGGRAEIVDAVRKIAERAADGGLMPGEIDEKTITDNLYLPDEPDMIIRPGGEHRVSNFLIWQSYYSEWYFTDKLWPEFTKKDFKEAIDEFRRRERRFGK